MMPLTLALCGICVLAVLSFCSVIQQHSVKLHDFENVTIPIKLPDLDNIITRRRVSRRPVMYGFNDRAFALPIDLITSWQKAWQESGWETRILSVADALMHPHLPVLKALLDENKVDQYERMCFYRWAAMAAAVTEEGGWMSDMDAFPLYIQPNEGLNLPNQGMFTLHDSHVPDLLSGSKAEWNRILNLFLVSIGAHEGFLSESTLIGTLIDLYGDDIGYIVPVRDEVVPGFLFDNIDEVACKYYHKKVKALHFSRNLKDEAFFGGFLEIAMRGTNDKGLTKVAIFNSDGKPVTKSVDGKTYENVNGPAISLMFSVEGEPLEELRNVYTQYWPRLTSLFTNRIRQQCNA